jgi:hypothetical protein
MDGRQDEAARLPLGFVLDRPRSALPPGFVFDPKPSDKWGKDPIVKPASKWGNDPIIMTPAEAARFPRATP